MANEQQLEEVISSNVPKQFARLHQDLEKSQQLFVDTVIAAEKLNQALSKSTTLRGLNDNQTKVNTELLKANKLNDQAIILEQRKQQAILRTQAMEDKAVARKLAAQAKQDKIDNARIVTLAKKGKTIISNSQNEIDAYNNTVNGNKKITTTLNQQNIEQAKLANSSAAISKVQKEVSVSTLKVSTAAVNAAKSIRLLEARLASYKAISRNATDPVIRSDFNLKVQETELEIERLSNIGKKGFDEFGNAIKKNKGFLSEVGEGIKDVASLLPGIGIAGLAAFAVEPILDYIKNLDIFKKKASVLIQEAGLDSSEYRQALSDISNLESTIEQFNSGLLTGREVVDVYNDSIGKTVGELKNVNEVVDFYNKQSKAYIQATYLRAQASSALAKAADAMADAQKRSISGPETIDYIKGFLASAGQMNFAGVLNNVTRYQSESVNKLIKDSEDYKKIFENLNAEFTRFSKANNLDFTPDGDDTANKLAQDTFDLQKQRLEITKKAFKDLADDEKLSLDERLNALSSYNESVRAIIRLEAENELAQKDISAKRRLIITEKANAELLAADQEYASESEKIFTDQFTKEEKARIESNRKEINEITTLESEKLTQLKKAYSNRTITTEQYEQLSLDIQNEYALKVIQAELLQAERLLEIADLSAEQRAKAEEELAALKIKYANTVVDQSILANQKILKNEEEVKRKREQLEKDLSRKKEEAAKEVAELTIAIVEGVFERQTEKVQEQIDLADSQKKIDIDNVNNSVASEEEKANKIAIIEARAQANRETLEQRQRQIEERQERFRKLAAAAEIGFTTLKTIFQLTAQAALLKAQAALLSTNPATLAFGIASGAAAGLVSAQIPYIAGMGAAQIGAILAFEKGGTVPKDGPIITGEAGTELRINPNGSHELTPDRANLSYAKAGTKIIPHHELMELMKIGIIPELPKQEKGSSVDISLLIAEQKRSTKELKAAYAKSKGHSTHITKAGWYNTQNQMDKLKMYKKRNLG